MTTIKLPIQRSWDLYEDRENLYVELDLEELRDFINEVIKEREFQKSHDP